MISLKDLYVVFNPNTPDERRALRNINFTLESGEFATIIGSNGAGKSTLLNVMAASIRPSSGTVAIDGEDRTNEPEFRRARSIGRVFKTPWGNGGGDVRGG